MDNAVQVNLRNMFGTPAGEGFSPKGRARRADFQVGGRGAIANANALAWANYGGSGGMLPRENLKLKSSEMARNGSKTAKGEVNFQVL